jgi:hypothetical protein
LKGVLGELLYNTSRENFTPILDNVINLLTGDSQNLAIDLLLVCCTVKDGDKISDWSKLATPLLPIFITDGLDSKQNCELAATMVSRADPITSRAITQSVFEMFQKKGEQPVAVFCHLVARLNESYFRKWVLEEFTKLAPF